MTLEEAMETLEALSEPGRAEQMGAYHKVERAYIGLPNPVVNDLTKEWRQTLSLEQRIELAGQLWDTNVFEARLAASKLLTQARIRPDEGVWALIQSWVPQFDSWAIADHACSAGARRLVADPARLDTVEQWTTSEHMWTKRAALVITLPWTKQNFPKPAEIEARERILGWAAGYVTDHEWFIQKSVAWWVRDLSRHDAPRARGFIEQYGEQMKPWARKEAGRQLS